MKGDSLSESKLTFIDTVEIKTIQVFVTEEINPRFMTDFIKTTLETNNISITKDIKVWSSFFEDINLYEIYIINSDKQSIDIFPNIFSIYYKDNIQSTFDLFIVDNLFVVYKDMEIYCFKSIDNSTAEDIKKYIEQLYNIKIDNTFTYNNEEFLCLTNNYLEYKDDQKKLVFYSLDKNWIYKYFIYYTIGCLAVFSYLLYDNYNQKLVNTNQKFLKLQRKYQLLQKPPKSYKKATPQLINLFKYIKLENILVENIEYKNKQVKLTMMHQDKDRLLNFITIYSGDIKIDKIVFINDENLYKMEVRIAF